VGNSCEEATGARCRCRCRGTLHGKAHDTTERLGSEIRQAYYDSFAAVSKNIREWVQLELFEDQPAK